MCCKWEDAGEHWKITGRNKGKEGELQPLYDLVYSLADDHGRHVVSFTPHVGDKDRDLRQGKFPYLSRMAMTVNGNAVDPRGRRTSRFSAGRSGQDRGNQGEAKKSGYETRDGRS